jgi:hypothetical protein
MKIAFYFAMIFFNIQIVLADRFEEGNSPFFFRKMLGTDLITQFKLLPKTGQQMDERYGWSETYWPSNLGGIAYRWSHPQPQPFRYKLMSKAEVLKMSSKDLSQLSPAELYDISMGDYNYTLTRMTLSKFSSRDLWWEGICHGWSQAASNYPEPAKVLVTNPDGVKVPFGSSDVKALLAMHDAYNYGGAFSFTGRRCKVSGKVPGEGGPRDPNTSEPSPEDANSPDCKDVNAGAFHLVLTNMLGIHARGFVADVDRYNDVWNQPITSYITVLEGEEPVTEVELINGIARIVHVTTTMTYGEELKFYTPELAATGALNFVSKEPVTRTPHQEFRSKKYEYRLELDGTGQVVGGSWLSQTRPDFLWMYQRSNGFLNAPIPLKGLAKIYKPVSL